APDWSESSRALAFELSEPGGDRVHVMLNAYWEPLDFELPSLPEGERWLRIADSALAPPADLADPPAPLPEDQREYHLEGRSTAILIATATEREYDKAEA